MVENIHLFLFHRAGKIISSAHSRPMCLAAGAVTVSFAILPSLPVPRAASIKAAVAACRRKNGSHESGLDKC